MGEASLPAFTFKETTTHRPKDASFLSSSWIRAGEVWPIATWVAPYFVFLRNLSLPVVSGGLRHGGRQHVAKEYMTVKGLKDFEMFVATFLYRMANESRH